MVPSFQVPIPPKAACLLLLLFKVMLGTSSAANTTAYCTRNANVNATAKVRVTPLPSIKLSVVVERNEGTVDMYQGQGNVSVVMGDGQAVWDTISNFSNANKDAMIVVVRNNFGTVNIHRDEQVGDDDYYYDTSKDREKNGEVMEVAHFGENKGLMEFSAGTSQALLVVLKNAAAAALASDTGTTGAADTSTKYSTFAATATTSSSTSNSTTNGTKPLRLDTCNLYELMGVNSAQCYPGCPVVSRGAGTLKSSAQQCVHKVSEICSCKAFLQGGRKCIKRVIAGQCKHTVPSAARFSQETIKQYTQYCQGGLGK